MCTNELNLEGLTAAEKEAKITDMLKSQINLALMKKHPPIANAKFQIDFDENILLDEIPNKSFNDLGLNQEDLDTVLLYMTSQLNCEVVASTNLSVENILDQLISVS